MVKMKTIYTLLLLLITVTLSYADQPVTHLSIKGSIKHSLSLPLNVLKNHHQSDIQLADIEKSGRFKGVFVFRGMSLKNMLQLAGIEKKETDFRKPVDLAVVLRNHSGHQAVLSWGEVLFKDPGHAIIALSARPVFPHKGVSHFKDKKAYDEMMATLNRTIIFPRLVITGEHYSDRCLEGICEIEVLDLKPKVKGKKSPNVFSEKFTISDNDGFTQPYVELPELPRQTVGSHVVGMGRGYHGTHLFSGIPLISLLNHEKLSMDLNTVFIISAPDAYRSLLSYGELFFNTNGSRILVSDKVDGDDWENGGKFVLILPDDQMADREVKAIGKIEVVRLAK